MEAGMRESGGRQVGRQPGGADAQPSGVRARQAGSKAAPPLAVRLAKQAGQSATARVTERSGRQKKK